MYTQSKAVFIKEYNEGRLKDIAYDATDHYNPTIVVYIDDTRVFGYQRDKDGNKNFFLVKLTHLNDDSSFKVGGRTYRTSNMMRINF